MKVTIFLLSILAGVLTWWRYSQPSAQTGQSPFRARVRRILHSLIAVIVVYFVLMAIAMVWLLFTT